MAKIVLLLVNTMIKKERKTSSFVRVWSYNQEPFDFAQGIARN